MSCAAILMVLDEILLLLLLLHVYFDTLVIVLSAAILVVSDENLKRFNSFDSVQTVTQSCLQGRADTSQSQSQHDFKQLSFRDAFGYCYESQLITGGNLELPFSVYLF